MSEPELFIVVSFSDGDDIFAVTTDDGKIVKREYAAVKDSVHGVLSTEDEIDAAATDVRYAVPVDLAREVFGWDL